MIPQSRPLPTSLLGQYHDGTCYEVGHTWHPSCIYCSLEMFYIVYIGAVVKVYAPVYLISDLVRRRPVRAMLSETLPHILRSSLFLAVNASGFLALLCFFRRVLGRFYFTSAAYLPAALASTISILLERKSRRGMLTGYMFTLALESVYRALKFRGYVTAVPYGEVMLFSLASAVLLPAYRSREGLHDGIGSALSVLFHPYYPKGLTRLVESMMDGPITMWRYAGYTAVKLVLLSLWCYALGYATQVLIGLVSSGTKAFRHLSRLKGVLLNWNNVKFGAFLAAYISGFKALEVLLFMLPVSRNTRMTIAGLVAGISMATIRSSSLSLYAATKALEVLYFKVVKKGWAKSWYYGDVFLYSLATGYVFHMAFFEPHNIRHSYWNFLNSASHRRLSQLNWEEIDRFGTHASTKFRNRDNSCSTENES